MANFLIKNLARLYLPLYQCDSGTMKIVYAGYSPVKRDYFFRLLPERGIAQKFLGRCWYWQIPDLVKSGRFDLAVSEVSRISSGHFQNSGGYMMPVWIPMRINIDRSISEICKRSESHFSDVLKRIRKYNLTYEMLTDEESFNYFNEKFYLPYISKRHREEAIINDLKKIWNSSPAPLLMFIKENGIIVAGSLIRRNDDYLYGVCLGILDGNCDYLRHGVGGAIYYYAILEGQKMGCRYLDVGTTRSFLTDGLTKYKMSLGAEFVMDKTILQECMWLGFRDQSDAARNFIRTYPFMYIGRDNKLVKSPS